MSDKPQLTIRPSATDDIEKLVALLTVDVSGHPPNDPANDIPATHRCPAAQIFVAEHDGEIIGTATASWNGRNGELRYFWVKRELRSTKLMQSIFDGLVNAAVTYLRSAGMQRVLFFVRREEEAMIRLYQRKLNARIVEPIVMAFSLDDVK